MCLLLLKYGAVFHVSLVLCVSRVSLHVFWFSFPRTLCAWASVAQMSGRPNPVLTRYLYHQIKSYPAFKFKVRPKIFVTVMKINISKPIIS